MFQDENILPIKPGEMTAGDAVRFFDNICDDEGNKLTKSKKRACLKEKMYQLYYFHPEKNKCTLEDGTTTEIIVVRQNPGRGKFCYFNNIEAPMDVVFKAFAKLEDITYKEQNVEHKKQGDLSANDAKQFFDDVKINDKKLSGTLKLERLHKLFAKLYANPKENICKTSKGSQPIVVERLSENNWPVLYLSTSENRFEVLQAFANWAGCIYRQDKENLPELPSKSEGEWTARKCEKIFHMVPEFDKNKTKQKASSRIMDWFASIGQKEHLNTIKLPNGKEVNLIVQRQSHSQRCWCLNVADEYAKPFVIKRVAEIMQADICLENVQIENTSAPILYKTMMTLSATASKSKDTSYYQAYAQKIYEKLNMSKEITVTEMLINKAKAQSK